MQKLKFKHRLFTLTLEYKNKYIFVELIEDISENGDILYVSETYNPRVDEDKKLAHSRFNELRVKLINGKFNSSKN
jgi:hypothetical protein